MGQEAGLWDRMDLHGMRTGRSGVLCRARSHRTPTTISLHCVVPAAFSRRLGRTKHLSLSLSRYHGSTGFLCLCNLYACTFTISFVRDSQKKREEPTCEVVIRNSIHSIEFPRYDKQTQKQRTRNLYPPKATLPLPKDLHHKECQPHSHSQPSTIPNYTPPSPSP